MCVFIVAAGCWSWRLLQTFLICNIIVLGYMQHRVAYRTPVLYTRTIVWTSTFASSCQHNYLPICAHVVGCTFSFFASSASAKHQSSECEFLCCCCVLLLFPFFNNKFHFANMPSTRCKSRVQDTHCGQNVPQIFSICALLHTL